MLGEVLAERAEDPALSKLRRRRDRRNESLREQGSDDRRGEKIASLGRIADPGANSRRRHQGAQQQPGLRGALRIHEHLRVCANREDRGAPKSRQIERRLHRVTAAAIGVEQRLALRGQGLVQSEYLARPWRGTQHGDLFLERLQSGKIDGIVLEIDDRGRKRRRRDKRCGAKSANTPRTSPVLRPSAWM